MGSSLSTNTGSSLPEELVQEILVRLPLDEPVHLARASLVCKAWRRALSDRRSFWRRCHEIHGAVPPLLLGYIQNSNYGSSPMRFVHTMPSIISSVTSMPAVDCHGRRALDCRHGRVLILCAKGDPSKRQLIVWNPITGSKQRLMLPPRSYKSYTSYPSYGYAGAVLCAKDGCDHVNCHDSSFHVVLVEANCDSPEHAIVNKYSSLTGAWGNPTSNHHSNYRLFPATVGNNLLIGDALYFPYGHGKGIIIKYDLPVHQVSKIDLPQHLYGAILMKAEDGGLGLATLKGNYIYLWSLRRQDVPNVIGGWVEHQVMNIGNLVPARAPFESYKVIGFAEGTNIIFINISTGIFMVNLESKKVSKVGQREDDRVDPILPYMSFYVPR